MLSLMFHYDKFQLLEKLAIAEHNKALGISEEQQEKEHRTSAMEIEEEEGTVAMEF